MLLDIRVIILAQDINSCFFIIKGLNQLMFPMKWQYSKGVASSLSLLYQPQPYFYGLVKVSIEKQLEIKERLHKERFSYLMIDTKTLLSDINTYSERKFPDFPCSNELEEQLNAIRKEYKIEKIGLIEDILKSHIKFSVKIRNLFLEIITPYVKDAHNIANKQKNPDFDDFSRICQSHFKKANKNKEKIEFMEELSFNQCFASLFDEISEIGRAHV